MSVKNLIYGASLMALLSGAPSCSPKSGKEDKDEPKTEAKKQNVETFKSFKQRMHKLTPSIMLETVLVEGVELDEHGLCKPYQDSRGVWTIGFGLTQLDGKPVTAKTRHITIQEAWRESINFYENKETYFFMWCYEIGLSDLNIDTDGKAMCLASVIYNSGTNMIENPSNRAHCNRNAELRNLYTQYGDNVTENQVRSLFVKYPVSALTSFGKVVNGGTTKQWADALGGFCKGGNGIRWRRWLEGQMALGNITAEDLLNLPERSMSDFYKVMGSKKSAFFVNNKINMETLTKFKAWAKNPVDKRGNPIKRKTLRQLLQSVDLSAVDQIENPGAGMPANTADFVEAQATYNCDEQNDKSYLAYQSGDYETAVEAGEVALQLAENNKQRSAAEYNIGIAYTAMGKYGRAVNHLKKAVSFAATDAQRKATQQALSEAEQKQSEQNRKTGRNVALIALGAGCVGFGAKRYFMRNHQKHR